MAKAQQQNRPQEKRKRSLNLIHEPKLNWDQVNEIRRSYVRHSSTYGTTGLATRYGVSPNNIYKILRGHTWKVQEGDGNVRPPLQGHITAKAFTNALIGTQASRSRLEEMARKYEIGNF